MSIQISDYIDVSKKAQELDCNIPNGIALLPRNFETSQSKEDLVHESATADIRILFRQNHFVETRIERDGDRFAYAQENAADWVGPIIFISASVLSQNASAVSIALNIISNYLTDWFKGAFGNNKVQLDIVIEATGCKRIHYEGNVEGLKQLEGIIAQVQVNSVQVKQIDSTNEGNEK